MASPKFTGKSGNSKSTTLTLNLRDTILLQMISIRISSVKVSGLISDQMPV